MLPTDVANAQQVEEAAERVEKDLGPIDIWVNDAMTTIFAPFLETKPDEFKHAIVDFTDSIRSELIHDKSDVHIPAVMLPAMNTPQFSWRRTRLPRHPQPVPPIFEPEVAARAIVWAASHKRREVYVVGPRLKRSTAMSSLPLMQIITLLRMLTKVSGHRNPFSPTALTTYLNPQRATTRRMEFPAAVLRAPVSRVSLKLETMTLMGHRGLVASAAILLAGLLIS